MCPALSLHPHSVVGRPGCEMLPPPLAHCRHCFVYAGVHWNGAAGIHACAHLLKQSSSTSAVPASDGILPAVKMCWAWCMQHAACDTLPLQQRCVDLERLEQATATLSPNADLPGDSPRLDGTFVSTAGDHLMRSYKNARLCTAVSAHKIKWAVQQISVISVHSQSLEIHYVQLEYLCYVCHKVLLTSYIYCYCASVGIVPQCIYLQQQHTVVHSMCSCSQANFDTQCAVLHIQ